MFIQKTFFTNTANQVINSFNTSHMNYKSVCEKDKQ